MTKNNNRVVIKYPNIEVASIEVNIFMKNIYLIAKENNLSIGVGSYITQNSNEVRKFFSKKGMCASEPEEATLLYEDFINEKFRVEPYAVYELTESFLPQSLTLFQNEMKKVKKRAKKLLLGQDKILETYRKENEENEDVIPTMNPVLNKYDWNLEKSMSEFKFVESYSDLSVDFSNIRKNKLKENIIFYTFWSDYIFLDDKKNSISHEYKCEAYTNDKSCKNYTLTIDQERIISPIDYHWHY